MTTTKANRIEELYDTGFIYTFTVTGGSEPLWTCWKSKKRAEEGLKAMYFTGQLEFNWDGTKAIVTNLESIRVLGSIIQHKVEL